MHAYIIWGLGAAVAWGTADFCAKKAATAFGFWPTVWGMNAVGALALAILWSAGTFTVASGQVSWLLLLGVGNAIGGVFFYYALEFGPLVLVSPITAAYPVVSALLAYLLSGERLGAAVAAAVGGVIAGTLLAGTGTPPAATAPAGHRSRPALVAAALGAVTFGTVFYFLAAGAARSSPAAPVLMFRLAGAALLALPLLWGQRLPRGLYRSGWLWATGLLDSFAYLLYAEAARHTAVSVVSALSGLFTIWTLLLAIAFLRERLRWWQWCGVVLIVAAIAALALQ